MSSHTFILHGDLTRLACDGWLLPSDATIDVQFRLPAEIAATWSPPEPTPEFRAGEVRVLRIDDWPGKTRPWLVNTGGFSRTDIGWYVAGVREFVDEAAPFAHQNPFVRDRARPLLGLPLVGTGAGGAAGRAGDIVGALLPTLFESADRNGVDIALVVHSAPAFAAAIQARERFAARSDRWADALTTAQRAVARSLAEKAQAGKLVLFTGAGVSMGANLPSWGKLLTDLAASSGVLPADDEQRTEEFRELDVLDQARLIEIHLENGPENRTIGSEIRKLLGPHEHDSLSHALLASLPISEAVTTNYDMLLQRAAEDARRPFGVLPYNPALHDRWLLKMHGCLSRPDDIVLTRSDFLRYDERRAALRGIVQAMLITKHMLFVGFSLTDDNFLRIIDDVRKAAAGDAQHPTTRFGTALALRSQPLFEQLWRKDLDWVHFDDSGAGGYDRAGAARRQEIFLDYLASLAAPFGRHLLDDRYDAVLTEEERALREHVRDFAAAVPEAARNTAAWAEIRTILHSLGGSDSN